MEEMMLIIGFNPAVPVFRVLTDNPIWSEALQSLVTPLWQYRDGQAASRIPEAQMSTSPHLQDEKLASRNAGKPMFGESHFREDADPMPDRNVPQSFPWGRAPSSQFQGDVTPSLGVRDLSDGRPPLPIHRTSFGDSGFPYLIDR